MTKYQSLLGKNEAELLGTLGLSESELAVYLAALELGQANVQEISRRSGIKRTSIYNFIDGLKARQLLSEIKKGKRRVYSTADPRTLADQAKMHAASIEQLIPELLAIANAVPKKPRVSFYEGIEGIKDIYRITLHDKHPIYAWEDLDRTVSALSDYFRSYPVERAKKNIPFRSIARDSKFARDFTQENDLKFARESRFISSEEFGTEINVFGNKVALFSMRKDFPFGVLIEDPALARTLRIIWHDQWNRLEPVSHA